MRTWRNWQTRKIQVLVSSWFMQVQVLLSAPQKRRLCPSFFVTATTCDNRRLSANSVCNLHPAADASLLRSFLSLQVLLSAPSVMVYKSFLIDHHFCFYKGKKQTFLNFPYLLGVWVGDKRHFNPYTFDDDIVLIYLR